MAANEKFCLKWNDFEHNVSSAFNTIREEKDFFDVSKKSENVVCHFYTDGNERCKVHSESK